MVTGSEWCENDPGSRLVALDGVQDLLFGLTIWVVRLLGRLVWFDGRLEGTVAPALAWRFAM